MKVLAPNFNSSLGGLCDLGLSAVNNDSNDSPQRRWERRGGAENLKAGTALQIHSVAIAPAFW